MNHSTFELLPGAIPPRRAYRGDAGLDICLQEDIVIYPHETVRSPAKILLHLDPMIAAHVMTRSSTSSKRVTIIPTVIDQSYNGKEISIFVSNFNTYPVELKKGDYLAQIVLLPYYTFANEEGPENDRMREDGERFGSSDRPKVDVNNHREEDPEEDPEEYPLVSEFLDEVDSHEDVDPYEDVYLSDEDEGFLEDDEEDFYVDMTEEDIKLEKKSNASHLN